LSRDLFSNANATFACCGCYRVDKSIQLLAGDGAHTHTYETRLEFIRDADEIGGNVNPGIAIVPNVTDKHIAEMKDGPDHEWLVFKFTNKPNAISFKIRTDNGSPYKK